MSWIIAYLLGGLAFVFAISVLAYIVEKDEKDRTKTVLGAILLSIVWPLGVVLVGGAMIGTLIKDSLEKKPRKP
jgi:tellurite resistance protein TehA-like permease